MHLLIALVRSLSAEAAVDSKRIYVIGNSMGGYGTWDLISREPSLFAAAVPICGGGALETAPTFAQVSLWAFHGAQDPIVAVDHSRRMIDALKKHGGKPRYSEFPDAGHDIAAQVFAAPGLAAWLFAQ